jgi:hypothetical protein
MELFFNGHPILGWLRGLLKRGFLMRAPHFLIPGR